ncbi:MAG TPA: SBBP repeat-containing protein [Bryobacteraceae bacterium]|nr:SBBP repeat-containing protein [Bryobacteraceae bacterium]
MRFFILIALLSTAYAGDFTTYIGGAPDQNLPVALATDSQGNTYVTGWGAFVTKLDPMGNVVFTKLIPFDGFAIAADPSGNIWIGGDGSPATAFLIKMAPDGTVLYSSQFGGKIGASAVNGIATDQSGNVYVTGWTDCSDFPTTPGLPASPVTGSYPPIYGLFAAKLDPTGQKASYSTVIAGPANCATCFADVPKTVGYGIAVDGAGNALVAGFSNTTGLPVGDPSMDGDFVFKINSAGNQIVYISYMPALIFSGSRPIAADASGNAYLTGYSDAAFPATPGAYQTTYEGGSGTAEAIAMKLDSSGKTVWATFVGRLGDANSQNAAIGLDSAGNVWITGTGPYAYLPLLEVPTFVYIGPDFADELNPDGSTKLNAIDFPPDAAGQDVVLDQSGVLHLAGPAGLITAMTPANPISPQVFSVLNAAAGQVTRWIAPGEIVSLYGTGLGPATPISVTPQNGAFPTSAGGVQVLVNGTPIPLLYVSNTQINAEIPSSVGAGQNGMALVQVMNNSAALPDFRLAVVASDFAAFTNPLGSLVVVNQDGTLNQLANPAQRGSVVSIWATGIGTGGPAMTGAVAPDADNYCGACQVQFSTGGTSTYITETAQYAGSSPGLVDGLMQINFQIPANLTNAFGGAWVSVILPGFLLPLQVGWVDVAQ